MFFKKSNICSKISLGGCKTMKNLFFKKFSALCLLALHKVKHHSQMTEICHKSLRFSRISTPKEKFRCFFGGGNITGENFGVFCSFSPPKQSLKSFWGYGW